MSDETGIDIPPMIKKLKANAREIRIWMEALEKVDDWGSPADAAVPRITESSTIKQVIEVLSLARSVTGQAVAALHRAGEAKFNEICAFLAVHYGFGTDPATLSYRQRDRIAGEVEELVEAGDEARCSNLDLEAQTELQRLLTEHREISACIRDLHPQLPRPKRPLFEAEVTFPDPSNVRAAITMLNAAGFDVEVLDLVDPCGTPFIWTVVSCEPGHDTDDDLWSRVQAIAERFGGDIDNAGRSSYRLKEDNAYDVKRDDFPELRRAAAIARAKTGLKYRVYSANSLQIVRR